MPNAPRGREKNVTGQGKQVYKRGSGLGTGSVGTPASASRPSGGSGGSAGGSRGSGQRSGGGFNPIVIIIALIAVLGGGGAGLTSMLGGSDSGYESSYETAADTAQQSSTQSSSAGTASSGSSSSSYSGSSFYDLLMGGSGSFAGSSTSTGWDLGNNTGKLDESVASGARAKYTTISDSKSQPVTIMVYMCGADLESKSGMATSDLQEMASADLGDNVNVIVYTGGASSWKNSIVSNQTTQIYQVTSGGLRRLESDMGNVSMTKSSTLTSFINYCTKNFPAERRMLIFWDHGGGSVTGYGYDEKFSSSGSMSLSGINEALKAAGTTFDFIGFDACLMASVENGLMLNSYADYMIASEETEPGVGWYYTNWLTKLAADTSMSTPEIGKNIADDFVSVCAQKCSGQKTTLSVVDLAELSATVPANLSSFSSSTLSLIENNEYKTVSDARAGAREFAASSKIDQVDLVSFAGNVGTDEASALADALLGAVKYNKTSSNMTNAYGLSIYFPYKKSSTLNNALTTYDAIDMDDDYAACIQKFASMQVSGQAASGGSSSPLSTLQGGSSSSQSSAYGTYSSEEMLTQLLQSLLSGSATGNVTGLTSSNSGFLGKSIDPEKDAQYLAENRFDPDQLVWTTSSDGTPAMYLTDEQWSLVQNLELSVYLDDGEGYIDLGLDNVYDFTQDGGLSGEYDGTWLAINDQPVAYYHTDTIEEGDDYTVTGYVPVMLNDVRSRLILVFNNDNPYGYVAGVETVYSADVTQTIAKNLTGLEDGDVIDFLCDYYTYDGEYQDTYYLGDQMIVDGDLSISNVYIDADAASPMYCFTDIYQQTYWTPAMNFTE